MNLKGESIWLPPLLPRSRDLSLDSTAQSRRDECRLFIETSGFYRTTRTRCDQANDESVTIEVWLECVDTLTCRGAYAFGGVGGREGPSVRGSVSLDSCQNIFNQYRFSAKCFSGYQACLVFDQLEGQMKRQMFSHLSIGCFQFIIQRALSR